MNAVGGLEEGLPGRLNLDKALVVVAAQEDGPGIGRIRLRQILDASAESLMPFVQDSIAPGSVVHTDGWPGYLPLESKGYKHDVTIVPLQPTTIEESRQTLLSPRAASYGRRSCHLSRDRPPRPSEIRQTTTGSGVVS